MICRNFYEAYTKLSQDDKLLINADAHIFGQAFVRIDSDGNVERIDPMEVFDNDKVDQKKAVL